MAEDVSAQVAGLISSSKVFGGSDNIRHGKYLFLIKRIFADLVETDKGKQKMAFWELTPIKSEPNPQVEGDRVDYVSATSPGSGPLKDDGTKPNGVGTSCALKVSFDGPGARSAGSNIKAAILGLFGKREGEIPEEEVNKTWLDLSLQRDLRAGECYPGTNIPAPTDKRANPACGMVIACSTTPKRKKQANDKGAFITKLLWECASPPGSGENSPDKVAARRAQIESQMAEEADDVPTPSASTPSNPYAAPQAPVMAPPPPMPSVTAAQAAFTPQKPWVDHPTAAKGTTPETRWFWSDPRQGGDNAVKNEVQLRNGQ